jgi:hypothetical protein
VAFLKAISLFNPPTSEQPMKLIEGRNGYLYVEYSEPYQFNNLVDIMNEVVALCKTENYQKFLVDISGMTGKVAPMERFELAVKGASLFLYKGKYAIVYRKEEINRFAETVGVNRGLNARIFSDMDEAMKWLGVNEE